MENDENIYRIDLQNVVTASSLVYELSTYLEREETKNKKILLQMNDIDLNVAQLKSIRSLINSINSSLSFISTKSQMTKEAAMSLEIVIADEDTQKTVEIEPEKTYKTLDELIEEKVDAVEEKAPVIAIETEEFTEKDAQNALESVFEEPFKSNEKEEEKEEVAVVEEKTGIEEEQESEKASDNDLIDPLDRIFETEKTLADLMDFEDTTENEESIKDVDYYKNLDNEFTEDDLEIDTMPTMYIKHTLRSGQVINYEGNVVIIGDCHTGSEVYATGDITVWGVLNGIAHAGNTGNIKAKIRALKMNAIQLRIADSFARKPDTLNTVLVEKTNVFTPEEARFIDGDIVIFKIND